MKLAKAIAFSSSAVYVYQLSSLGYAIFLARTFTPYLLGAFGIASAITLLSGEFRALGTGEYLIREKQIERRTVRNSIGISLAISLTLFIFIFLFSNKISEFYNDQLVGELTLIFATSLLVTPFNSINSALLTKELQFHKVIFLDWSNFLIGIFVSILLISLDFGIYAIAIGPVAGAYSQFLLTFFLRSRDMTFIPGLHRAGDQIKFGGISSLASIFERLNIYSIDLITGKMEGVRSAALISKAVSTAELIFHVLLAGSKDIALPYISKSRTEQISWNYIQATIIANYLSLSVLASCVFIGDELILFLFGDQWVEAAALVPFVSLWAIFKNAHPFVRALMVSINKERAYLKNQAVGFFLTTLSLFVGLGNGDLKTMTILLFISGLVYCFITTYQIFSMPEFRKDFYFYLYKNLKLFVLIGNIIVVAWFLDAFVINAMGSNFLKVAVFGLSMILVWCLLNMGMRTELYEEIKKLGIKK